MRDSVEPAVITDAGASRGATAPGGPARFSAASSGVSAIRLPPWRGSSDPRNLIWWAFPSGSGWAARPSTAAAASSNPSLSLRVLLFVSVLWMRFAWTAALPAATRRPPPHFPGKQRLASGGRRCMQDRSEPLAETEVRAALGRQALSGGPRPHHCRDGARYRTVCAAGRAKRGPGLPRDALGRQPTGAAEKNRQLAAWLNTASCRRGGGPCAQAHNLTQNVGETDAGKESGRCILI